MENYNLANIPEISIALSKFLSNEQEFKAMVPKAPTMENVVEILKVTSKIRKIDYRSLDNIIIVPAGEDNEGKPLTAVLFGDDLWSCKLKGTEVDRSINFDKLTAKLKFEAKLICLADIWLLSRKAKLGSIFRKCQIIVIVAKLCESINILSLTHLSQEQPRNRLKTALREKISTNSIKNYYIALNTLCDMANTPLASFGLCVDIPTFNNTSNFSSSVNQTYCMPISIGNPPIFNRS